MFGSGKIKELEARLIETIKKAEAAEKEKKDLQGQLEHARAKIADLEKRVSDNELETLKAQSKQAIVEYEGLKGLYTDKVKAFEDSRTAAEEAFAKEAATKRHDLSEEIRENKESNQKLVSETVSTFAGSYMYYLDQIRALMDALSRAATETGETLFSGDTCSIRERFGSSIVEHLQSDADALKQNAGDVMLIGAEEVPEEAVEEAAEEAEEAVEEAADAAEEIAEEVPEAVEEAVETAEETAEEVVEAAEEAAEEVSEEAAEIVGAAAEAAEEIVAEAPCCECAEETAAEAPCCECAEEPERKEEPEA